MDPGLPHCGLYQGKPADTADGRPLFAGKQVAGADWRRSWAKNRADVKYCSEACRRANAGRG